MQLQRRDKTAQIGLVAVQDGSLRVLKSIDWRGSSKLFFSPDSKYLNPVHDGSLRTLEDVVEFYSEGGRPNPHLDPEIRPLRLTAEEKRALVVFLRSLTGRMREGWW